MIVAEPRESPTTDLDFDLDMFLLRQAADNESLDEFLHLAEHMDWQARTPEDYLLAIRLALKVEAHLTARRLAQQGQSYFPDHPEIARYARVLAPVETLRTGPLDPGVASNNLWLRAHRDEYVGQWVALRDGNLLAWGGSFQEVRQQVGPLKNTRILVTKVY